MFGSALDPLLSESAYMPYSRFGADGARNARIPRERGRVGRDRSAPSRRAVRPSRRAGPVPFRRRPAAAVCAAQNPEGRREERGRTGKGQLSHEAAGLESKVSERCGVHSSAGTPSVVGCGCKLQFYGCWYCCS